MAHRRVAAVAGFKHRVFRDPFALLGHFCIYLRLLYYWQRPAGHVYAHIGSSCNYVQQHIKFALKLLWLQIGCRIQPTMRATKNAFRKSRAFFSHKYFFCFIFIFSSETFCYSCCWISTESILKNGSYLCVKYCIFKDYWFYLANTFCPSDLYTFYYDFGFSAANYCGEAFLNRSKGKGILNNHSAKCWQNNINKYYSNV